MSAIAEDGLQGAAPLTPLTYKALLVTHLGRSKFNKKGGLRPEKSLENIASTASKWMLAHGLDPHTPVGEEMGLNFREGLEKYLKRLAGGHSAQYVKDVKSRLGKLRRTYFDLLKSDGLPKSFPDAIRTLCEMRRISVSDLDEKFGTGKLIINWVENYILPHVKELPSIHLIEDYFDVSRNTLVSKLPPFLLGSRAKSRKTGTTSWRANMSELKKLFSKEKIQVRLCAFKWKLKEEWDDLFRFYTDSDWLREHNLKRNSRWTIREDDFCGTAGKYESMIMAYLGFLRLPEDHLDPKLRGRGYREEQLSLAFFSSAEDVKTYIQFLKTRTPKNVLSTTVEILLTTCNTFLLPKTGFLWQQPQFGDRLPVKVPRDRWHRWCNKARRELGDLLTGYKTDDEITSTRKPLELIKPIVRALQNPLDIVEDMLERMREAMKYVHNDVIRAISYRDYLLIKLESCIPLRAYNVSLLTYKDDNTGSFRELTDGTLWLYIPKEHFKNRRRKDLKDFYIQIEDEELIDALKVYNKEHRKHLLGGKCDECASAEIEDRNSECRSARASGANCKWSHYLFVPKALASNKKSMLKCWSAAAISSRVYDLTRDYMPQYPGFTIHWFRHLLASDYIKNHPNGFGVAATLLHDTESTVRKYYAWVEPAEGVRIYNQYRRERKKAREQTIVHLST